MCLTVCVRMISRCCIKKCFDFCAVRMFLFLFFSHVIMRFQFQKDEVQRSSIFLMFMPGLFHNALASVRISRRESIYEVLRDKKKTGMLTIPILSYLRSFLLSLPLF